MRCACARLPVSNPQELVTIDFAKNSSRSGSWSTRSARLTSVLWEQVHGLTEPFSATIAWSAMRFNLAQGGEARYAEGQYVSGDFFRVLGVQPWIGRTFTADDDRPGCGTPGAVVSYAFWQRELGGDRAALGRELSLDGRRFPVIGVTPPQFFGVEVGNRFDVAVPLCSDSRDRARGAYAMVALRHGPPQAGMDGAAPQQLPQNGIAGHHGGEPAAVLSPGPGQAISGE